MGRAAKIIQGQDFAKNKNPFDRIPGVGTGVKVGRRKDAISWQVRTAWGFGWR